MVAVRDVRQGRFEVKDNRLELDKYGFRIGSDCDLELFCSNCENTVTIPEDGDSLDTVARTCDAHVCIHASDAGTWLDGAQGWHNTYRVIERAEEFGFEVFPPDRTAIESYRDTHGEEYAERIAELSEEATDYLNEHAPDGYVFAWNAGELILCEEDEAELF
jgi:hypothetical protein